MSPKPQELHQSTLYTTDVRQVAHALGIDVSPSEYVELIDSTGSLKGRLTVQVTLIKDLRESS